MRLMALSFYNSKHLPSYASVSAQNVHRTHAGVPIVLESVFFHALHTTASQGSLENGVVLFLVRRNPQ